MSVRDSMPVRYGKLFWSFTGPRALVIVGLTLVMSYAEGFGIALFFPLLASPGSSNDPVSRTFLRLFERLHIEPKPAATLPLIALIFVGKGILSWAVAQYTERLSQRVVRRMRRQLIDALGHAQYEHVTAHGAGDNANLAVAEIGRAAAGFIQFAKALSPLLSALILFGIVAVLDWRSTLVCVAMGATLFAALRLTGRSARFHSTQLSSRTGTLTGLVVQTFHAFRYLRATGRFGVFERRIDELSETSLDSSMKAASAGIITASVTQPLMVVFLTALLYYRTTVRGEALASLFVVLLYFLRIMTELYVLQTAWQMFCAYAGSIDAVQARIESAQLNIEPNGSTPFAGLQHAISCEHVSFAYGAGAPVLRDVSLHIPRCTTVAFVGASGSGKSTLVDVLVGTLKPQNGVVRIDGCPLARIDLGTLRQRVGYVPQEAVLFDDTVANNIALWADLDGARIEDAAGRAHASEFIEALPAGYQSPIGDRGLMLSGGQRQRLAIARELVKDPEILVLDEATSALDSGSERAIQQSIDALRGRMTILIIAHRFSTVRAVDTIYVLEGGRIVESGGYEELVAQGGRFREMVALQSLETK